MDKPGQAERGKHVEAGSHPLPCEATYGLELLANLVHESPDVVVVHDSLQILYLNRKGLESIGAESLDDVVGRSVWDFVSREYHAILQERVAVMLASGRGVPPFELPLVRADGTEIWGEISSAPVRFKGHSAVQTVVRDVTRRRETEAQLTASEARYRSLFHGVPVGLYRSTLDGRLLDANDALVHLLGYEDRDQLMRAGTIGLYLDPAERERWVGRALAAPESSESEVRLQRRDGSEVLVRLHSRVKYGPTGEVDAFEGSVEDVTRTRRAEARYRLLFETMAQGVIYHDARGRLLSANPAAERILGVSARALIEGSASLDDLTFQSTDGSPCPASELPPAVALRDGRSMRALLGFRRKPDDVLRWIEIESIPLFHPGADRPYQVFCTLADATERREKEEALRLSEQRFDRAMEGSGLGLWDWDLTTGEIYVDDRWYAMLGYGPQEFPLHIEEMEGAGAPGGPGAGGAGAGSAPGRTRRRVRDRAAPAYRHRRLALGPGPWPGRGEGEGRNAAPSGRNPYRYRGPENGGGCPSSLG